MKRTAKICIAITFISLLAFSANAQQPSYVLTMDGDSIVGTVKSVKKKSIKFIPENEQKAVIIAVEDIFAVKDAVKDLYYKSFSNPLKKEEIELVQSKTKGPIFLYEFKKRTFGPQVGVGIGVGRSVGTGMSFGLTMSRVMEGYITDGENGELNYIYTAENMGNMLEYNIENLFAIIGDEPSIKAIIEGKKNRQFTRANTEWLIQEYNKLRNK